MDTKVRIHLVITGRVQGVFFRYSAKDKADELGVYGWIRNQDDGNVEAVIQGKSKQLDKFIKWCKEGSLLAKVDKVEVEELKGLENFSDFSIN